MKRVAGFLTLLLSWLAVFWILAFLTELILVPWDTAITRPAVGTWQRTVNDFFETPPGSYIIPALLLAGSMSVVFHSRQRPWWRFALLNLVFSVGSFGLFVITAMINNAVFPHPPVLYEPSYRGYYRSIIPGLVIGATCAAWLIMQRRVAANQT